MTDTRCPTCQDHLRRRRPALLPLFGRTMQATGEPAHEIRARFLGGLHKRHLDGHELKSPAVLLEEALAPLVTDRKTS
jgi:hypothetical protein